MGAYLIPDNAGPPVLTRLERQLREENAQLKADLDNLRDENTRLRERLTQLQAEIQSLENDAREQDEYGG